MLKRMKKRHHLRSEVSSEQNIFSTRNEVSQKGGVTPIPLDPLHRTEIHLSSPCYHSTLDMPLASKTSSYKTRFTCSLSHHICLIISLLSGTSL